MIEEQIYECIQMCLKLKEKIENDKETFHDCVDGKINEEYKKTLDDVQKEINYLIGELRKLQN